MGNCIQKRSSSSGSRGAFAGEGRRLQALQLQGSGGGLSGEDRGASASPMPVVKVKMVLTKAELGWLVSQLKAGDRRLEDVLHEMARRNRDAGDGWRPSLESIVECPAEMMAEAASQSDE